MNNGVQLLGGRFAGAGPWIARNRGLLLVLGAALALRLAFALTMNQSFGDQQEYLAGANRLLDGRPLPAINHACFVRAPGYALFVAAVWSICPARTLVSIRLAQAILSTATCFLIYLLAMRIRDDKRAALVAAFAAGVYPYFVYHVGAIGSECLFGFLVALGTYCLARGVRKDRVEWGYVLSGIIVYAGGILVRPNLAPTEALLGLLLAWWYRRQWRTVLAVGLVMIAGTLLVTTPWNVAVARQGLGRIFVSDGAGMWYYSGHQDLAVRIYCDRSSGSERAALVGSSFEVDPVAFLAPTLPRSEQAGLWWRTGLRWDSEHPSRQFCLATGKLWSFWRPWVEPDAYPWKFVAASLASLPVLVLGLAGLWKLRAGRDAGLALIVAVNVVAGTVSAMVYSTEVRYRIPVVDLLLVGYAACVAVDLARGALTRLRSPTSARGLV